MPEKNLRTCFKKSKIHYQFITINMYKQYKQTYTCIKKGISLLAVFVYFDIIPFSTQN